MAVVVIGGQASGVGKTGVVCALIAGMGERRWTAIKISQAEVGEGWGSGDAGEDAAVVAIHEELAAGSGTDSARYLAAGAERAFWVSTRQGELAAAMPRLSALIAGAEDSIVESNSVLEFVRPDFYAVVVDPEVADFKASALRYLDRADALLVPKGGLRGGGWAGVPEGLIAGIRQFEIGAPEFGSEEFREFVAEELRRKGR
jgi:molybdopterin-guanine dinucleotide biosynthesis protein